VYLVDPLVEPGRRKPGHRPHLLHWSAPKHSSRAPDLPRYRGRKNSETSGNEEGVSERGS